MAKDKDGPVNHDDPKKGNKNRPSGKEGLKARQGKEKTRDVAPVPGLYGISNDCVYPRPGHGPLVEPTYNLRKASGQKEMYLPGAWQDFMKDFNTKVAFDRIVAPDWGPSKGRNEKGMLRFNALIYPGRNIVRILQVAIGKDGGLWGLLDSLDASVLPVVNVSSTPDAHPEYDAPHHYHSVYSCTQKGLYFLQENSPVVPIVSIQNQEQWIQMEKLEAIDLPKTVTISAGNQAAICATAGDLTSKTGELAGGQTAQVTELRIAKGGIWGKVETGWIALRYRDKNPTDWII